MLKTSEKEKAIAEYIEEIRKRYPYAEPKVMQEKVYKEDAWVRITVPSPKHTNKVLDAAIELQQQWYLERGVYIFVTVSGTGPISND